MGSMLKKFPVIIDKNVGVKNWFRGLYPSEEGFSVFGESEGLV